MCWNPQSKASFSKTIELKSHMLRFTLKWMFSHLSPWNPHKCVLKPSKQGLFSWDNQFEGSPAYVYLKNECFQIYLLENPINVCWNPQNNTHFFQDVQFEGSPLYVYSQNECFPIYLHRNPINVCWNPPEQGSCFPKIINLRGHMPRFTLKMNIFLSISIETP